MEVRLKTREWGMSDGGRGGPGTGFRSRFIIVLFFLIAVCWPGLSAVNTTGNQA